MSTAVRLSTAERLDALDARLEVIENLLRAQVRSTDDIHGWLAQIMGTIQRTPLLSKFLTGG